jgi:hypothetical protein
MALSRALGVGLSELVESGGEKRDVNRREFLTSTGAIAAGTVAPIRTALINGPGPTSVPGADLDGLRRGVDELQAVYQAARYERAGSLATGLVSRAEACVGAASSDRSREACRLLATVYHAVASLLSRMGETETAWVVADRAVVVAQHVEDRELLAVGLFRLAHVLLRAGRAEDAHRAALRGVADIRADRELVDRPSAISIHGALLLAAALAAANLGDQEEAGRLLRRAKDQAIVLGRDRNDHWSAFGPTNVRIHAASAAVALGDPRGVIRAAETVDVDGLPVGLRGRRSQVHLDLAWAYGQERNDPAAVLSLLAAEGVAPESLRYNTAAHELLRACLRRERRPAVPGLRGLVERTGVVQ